MVEGTTGRDGGQDTHGAVQSSYQVTFDPTGWCVIPPGGQGRQISFKTHGRSQGGVRPCPGWRDPVIMSDPGRKVATRCVLDQSEYNAYSADSMALRRKWGFEL